MATVKQEFAITKELSQRYSSSEKIRVTHVSLDDLLIKFNELDLHFDLSLCSISVVYKQGTTPKEVTVPYGAVLPTQTEPVVRGYFLQRKDLNLSILNMDKDLNSENALIGGDVRVSSGISCAIAYEGSLETVFDLFKNIESTVRRAYNSTAEKILKLELGKT